MASITSSLKNSIKNAIGGSVIAEKASAEKSVPFLKISAKNFLSISGFARDLNVAKRNIEQLVELMGGKPVKGDKVDAHFLKEDERERKLEVERAKRQEEKKVEPVKPKKKGKGLFDKLKEKFSENKMLKSLGKFLVIGAIVTTIFVAFKDSIVEWASELWDNLKTQLEKFFEDIKTWLTDSIQTIIDGVGEFIDKMIKGVTNFFGKVGDFFVDAFGKIKDFFEPVMGFVSKVWNKFTGMIDEFKGWLKPKVEGFLSNRLTKGLVPDFLIKFVGLGQKPKEPEKIDDSAEKKKLERQQKEALDTQRVKQQEKKAQYKGRDEIVRQRHGIEEKTTTMRAEEAKKAEPVPKGALVTSDGTPVVSGTGEVVMTGEAEPKVAPAVDQTEAETKRLKEKKDVIKETKPTPAPEVKPSETKPSPVTGDPASQIIAELNNSGITSKRAQANILAQVAKESNFKPINEELGKWSAQTLFRLYGPPGASYVDSKGKPATVPQHKNKVRFPTWDSAVELVKKGPEAIGDVVYGGRMGNNNPGDGFKYRGRGYIQLTGKDAYDKIGKILGINLLSDPDKVNDPSIVARIVPAFFLKFKGKKPEDLEDINSVNKLVGAADPKSQEARIKLAGDFESKLQSGQAIGSTSAQIASGQRQQQKPQTPVIVNTPTTNNTVVKKTQTSSTPPKNTARVLAARAS
jgi:predicted chitinase